MSDSKRTLEVAAFMDSPQAAKLQTLPAETVRKVVRAFLDVCYEDLGKEPRLLDGQDAHAALGHLLPGRFARRDPKAEHAPKILEAYLDFLGETAMVPEAFELRQGFLSSIDEFVEAVETGHVAHHGHRHAEKPVVHQAPKLGRNDPCFCGSGKKFKKCCGA